MTNEDIDKVNQWNFLEESYRRRALTVSSPQTLQHNAEKKLRSKK